MTMITMNTLSLTIHGDCSHQSWNHAQGFQPQNTCAKRAYATVTRPGTAPSTLLAYARRNSVVILVMGG